MSQQEQTNNPFIPLDRVGQLHSSGTVELLRTIDIAPHHSAFSPEALLGNLQEDPRFAFMLEQPAVREGYSIGEHTLMALRQHEKYFLSSAERELPLTPPQQQLLILLHDIGKGLGSNRNDQHDHTINVLDSLHAQGAFSERTYQIVRAVISGDPLGRFLANAVAPPRTAEEKVALAQKIARGEHSITDFQDFVSGMKLKEMNEVIQLASIAEEAIRTMAQSSQLSSSEFFELLTTYFQTDTLAYSFDAPRDHTRSPLLTEEDTRDIEFTHDRPLRGISTCETGETTQTAYFQLERVARGGGAGSFPIERGYPSLDFLYRLRADFNPQQPVAHSFAFNFDSSLGRLPFQEPIERAYQLLHERITSH